LADRPDIICSDLIKTVSEDVIAMGQNEWSALGMSKLLFLAGQIALQHNLHLDSIEKHCKPKPTARTMKDIVEDGLDETTASVEDNIAEMIREVKEKELLYGDKSLLKVFGPLAAFVAMNNLIFKVPFKCFTGL